MIYILGTVCLFCALGARTKPIMFNRNACVTFENEVDWVRKLKNEKKYRFYSFGLWIQKPKLQNL